MLKKGISYFWQQKTHQKYYFIIFGGFYALQEIQYFSAAYKFRRF
jgi:hypothetical protein